SHAKPMHVPGYRFLRTPVLFIIEIEHKSADRVAVQLDDIHRLFTDVVSHPSLSESISFFSPRVVAVRQVRFMCISTDLCKYRYVICRCTADSFEGHRPYPR